LYEFTFPSEPVPKNRSSGEVWLKALSSPRVETLKHLIIQERSPLGKGLYWLFLTGGFGGLLAGLLRATFNQGWLFGLTNPSPAGDISSSAILGAFFGAILFSIGVPLITLVNTWLIQMIVRRLGGETSFSRLLFAFAVYQAPLGLLICTLIAIPTIGCLALPLMVYWLVLSVLAVKAACEVDTGKAILCNLAPFGSGAVFGVCMLAFTLSTSIEIL
jgi:hypothetical protein